MNTYTKKIFTDLDGVLADFNGRVFDLGYSDKVITNEECFQRHMIDREYHNEFFLKLNPLPTYYYLMEYLRDDERDRNIEFIILSYVGAHHYQRLVIDEKSAWLTKYGLGELTFVPVVESASFKKFFSAPNTKLLDDSESNVVQFNEWGQGTAYQIDDSIKKATDSGYLKFREMIEA